MDIGDEIAAGGVWWIVAGEIVVGLVGTEVPARVLPDRDEIIAGADILELLGQVGGVEAVHDGVPRSGVGDGRVAVQRQVMGENAPAALVQPVSAVGVPAVSATVCEHQHQHGPARNHRSLGGRAKLEQQINVLTAVFSKEGRVNGTWMEPRRAPAGRSKAAVSRRLGSRPPASNPPHRATRHHVPSD